MAVDPMFGLRAQSVVNAQTPTEADIGQSLIGAVQLGQQVRSNALRNDAQELENRVRARLNPIRVNAAQIALRQADLNAERTEQVVADANIELGIRQALQPTEQATRRSVMLAQGVKAEAVLREAQLQATQRAALASGLDQVSQAIEQPVDLQAEFDQALPADFAARQRELNKVTATPAYRDGTPAVVGFAQEEQAYLDQARAAAQAQVTENTRAVAEDIVSAHFQLLDSYPQAAQDPGLRPQLSRLQLRMSTSPELRSAYNAEVARRAAPVGLDSETRLVAQALAAQEPRSLNGEEIQALHAVASERVRQGRVFENFSAEETPLVKASIEALSIKGTGEERANRRAYLMGAAMQGPEVFRGAASAQITAALGEENKRSLVGLQVAAEGLQEAERIFASLVDKYPELENGSLTADATNTILKKLRSQDSDIARFETVLKNTQARFVQSISGAAVTDQEFKRLSSVFGKLDEGTDVFNERMDAMRTAFNRQMVLTGTQSGVPQSAVEFAFLGDLSRGTDLDATEVSAPEPPAGMRIIGEVGGVPIAEDPETGNRLSWQNETWNNLSNQPD